MLTVLGALGVFISLILVLTAIIIMAEQKLVSRGDVRIVINGDEESGLVVEGGSSLLNTLGEQGIFLPSACGGQGTCGTCMCRILDGGGELLPTETTFITRRLAKEGWRLSCQVKVREDMSIHLPDDVFSAGRWECRVISNRNVSTFIKEFTVQLPDDETLNFRPGGYIQVEVPGYSLDFARDIDISENYREEWERIGLLDLKVRNSESVVRAYSMANHPAEGNIVRLNVRIAAPPWDSSRGGFRKVPPGIASSYIFSRKPGDSIIITGPYGEFFMQDSDREMVYIGGGAGMAPLRSHIFHLFYSLRTHRKVSFWYGARSRKEIFYEKEFRKIELDNPGFSFHVALSEPLDTDRWEGDIGFIHQVVLDKYLISHPAPEDVEYYLCGPPVMIDAVEKMLADLGVEPEMIRFDRFG